MSTLNFKYTESKIFPMNRKSLFLLTFFLALIALVACNTPASTSTTAPTKEATTVTPKVAFVVMTNTPMVTVTQLSSTSTKTVRVTSTQHPTFTLGPPTNTPVATNTPYQLPPLSFSALHDGTEIPIPSKTISPENASQISRLARWGQGKIRHIVYSSGGRLMAIGTSVGVYVYDMNALKEILVLDTPASIRQVLFSPDTEKVLAVLTNGHLLVWQIESGKLVETIKHLLILQAAYSPSGHLLVAEKTQNTNMPIQVKDVTQNSILLGEGVAIPFKDYLSEVQASPVLFTPDTSIVIVKDHSNVAAYNTQNGKKLFDFEPPPCCDTDENWNFACSEITTMSISDDSKYFAYGCVEHGNVNIYRLSDGDRIQTITDLGWDVQSIALSQNGSIIEIDYGFWRVSNGTQLHNMGYSWGGIASAAYSRNSQRIAVGWNNGQVALIRTADGSLDKLLYPYSPNGYGVGIDPNGKFIANSTEAGVQLRDIKNGVPYLELEAHPGSFTKQRARKLAFFRSGPANQITDMALSSDGSLVAVTYDTGKIWVWSTLTGVLHAKMDNEDWDWRNLIFAPDNQYIYSTASLMKWDIEAETWTYLDFLRDYVTAIDISRDGRWMALGQWQSPIKVISLPDLKDVFQFDFAEVNLIAFSPDASQIAFTQDNILYLYDTITQSQIALITGIAEQISSISYSPDGQMIVTGSNNGAILFWNTQNGELVGTLRGHLGWITEIVFASDGKYMVSTSDDGTISIWGIAP